MRIKPFKALRPAPEFVEQVASVPYDTINTQEAKALAGDNTRSFLHVIRPEIDLPADTDIYSDAVYSKALENFSNMRTNGTLISENCDSIYVYRQIMNGHAQHGIVACCHIDEYLDNTILKHEKTRQDKEDDRTRHVMTLEANTGPVFLTYRDSASINEIVESVETQTPLYDITAPDGIQHTVWKSEDANTLVNAFMDIPVAYVADGHHRSAAAARAGSEKRGSNPDHNSTEEYNWFLTVLFPASQLRILPYNRCVKTLNGLEPGQFLDSLSAICSVSESSSPTPAGPGKACLYINNSWHLLEWEPPANADPVEILDVSWLQNTIFAPLLDIQDPRTDKRIDFIGGIRGTAELENLVNSGEAAAAFSLYPVSIDQMMDIADAGRIMPPKSTWFEPKLRSGLLIHTL